MEKPDKRTVPVSENLTEEPSPCQVVQVVPHGNYTVDVYFADGKIVTYDVGPKLESGVFRALKDTDVFMNRCCIMNDTLAWDLAGNQDATQCIDIDPDTLYALEARDEERAG